jgi:hypothetical protein
MKTGFKFLRNISLIIALLAIASSCLNDTFVDHRAYGDAHIRTYWQEDQVVYGVELYSYSNFPMKGVTAFAKSNPDQVFTLDTVRFQYTYRFKPEKSSYTTTKPSADWYYFDVAFGSDDQLRVSDYLDTQVIAPPIINDIRWDENLGHHHIEWDLVNNAQYYKLFLLNSNSEVVFETDLLEGTQGRTHINHYTNGWISGRLPKENTTLKLQLNAYLFEPMPTSFDIQCIATNDLHSIEWKMNY